MPFYLPLIVQLQLGTRITLHTRARALCSYCPVPHSSCIGDIEGLHELNSRIGREFEDLSTLVQLPCNACFKRRIRWGGICATGREAATDGDLLFHKKLITLSKMCMPPLCSRVYSKSALRFQLDTIVAVQNTGGPIP